MANNYAALRAALYTYLNTGTNAFKTAVGSKLYFHLVPQLTALPYAVFDIINANEDQDTASKFYTHIVQFNLAGVSAGAVETLMSALTTMMDDNETSLSVTSHYTLRIKKDFERQLQYEDKVWSQIIQYSIEIQI